MSANGMDKSMRDPLAQARGLGSAKDGVHHWWMQRLTAVVLALLTPWFLWQMLILLDQNCQQASLIIVCTSTGGEHMRQVLGEPGHALPMLAFLLALFWHAKLGVQVVIEDYVHTRWLEITAQLAVKFFCAIGALIGVLAIVRIALG